MNDLSRSASPRIIRQLEVPAGAMGVALSADARMALVVSATDESLSVLSVEPGKALKLIETNPTAL